MYTDEEMKIYSITKCDVCRDKDDKKEKASKYVCNICFKNSEMLKKYKNNKNKTWIHINCIKWFMNHVKIEVENGFIVFNEIKALAHEVIVGDCAKCRKSNDFKINCSGKNCDIFLHKGCIESSWIYEETNYDRPKFKFLNFRCDKCTASKAQNKKNDKFLETKTYGKDINNMGESQANIKFAELQNLSRSDIILHTVRPVLIDNGGENNLKFKMEFRQDGDNSNNNFSSTPLNSYTQLNEVKKSKNFIGKKRKEPLSKADCDYENNLKHRNNNTYNKLKALPSYVDTNSNEAELFISTVIRCDICTLGLSENKTDNFRRCENCFTCCHISCAREIGDKETKICKKCKDDKEGRFCCVVCDRKTGSMVKCDGGWIHVICAMMLKKYFYQKHDQAYALSSNQMNNKNKIKKICHVCRIENYYTVDCVNCNISFHPYCGLDVNFEFVLIDNKCGSYFLANELNATCENHFLYKLNTANGDPINKKRLIEISDKNTSAASHNNSPSDNFFYENIKKSTSNTGYLRINNKNIHKKFNKNKPLESIKNIRKLRTRHNDNKIEIDSINFKQLKKLVFEKYKVDPYFFTKIKEWNWEVSDYYFLPITSEDLEICKKKVNDDEEENHDILEKINSIISKGETIPSTNHLSNSIIVCKIINKKKEFMCIYDISKLEDMRLYPDYIAYYLELLNLQTDSKDFTIKYYKNRRKGRLHESNKSINKNKSTKELSSNITLLLNKNPIIVSNDDMLLDGSILSTSNKFKIRLDPVDDYIESQSHSISISNQIINQSFKTGSSSQNETDNINDDTTDNNSRNKFLKKIKLLDYFKIKRIDKFAINIEENAAKIVNENLKIKDINKENLHDIDYEILVKTEMLKLLRNRNIQNFNDLTSTIENNNSLNKNEIPVYPMNEESKKIIFSFKSVSKFGNIKRRLKKGVETKSLEELVKNRGNTLKIGKSKSRDENDLQEIKTQIHETLLYSESECCVCFYSDGDDLTPIVFCDSCNVSVHQECYGIKEIPEGDYFCDLCVFNNNNKFNKNVSQTPYFNPQTCDLCGTSKGAMKKLDKLGEHWAHVTCILFSKFIKFNNYDKMNEVSGFKNSITGNRGMNCCNLCKKNSGDLYPCNKCMLERNFNYFHFFCAYLEGVKIQIKESELNKSVHYINDDKYIRQLTPVIYCDKHTQENDKIDIEKQKYLRLLTYHKQLIESPEKQSKKTEFGSKFTGGVENARKNIMPSLYESLISYNNIEYNISTDDTNNFHNKQAIVEYYKTELESDSQDMVIEDHGSYSTSISGKNTCGVCFQHTEGDILTQCSQCQIYFHNV